MQNYLPPLSDEEYKALKEDIKQNGCLSPITVDEYGGIIDGWHRDAIYKELGIESKKVVLAGLSEDEKRSYSIKLNILRRQLSKEQLQQLIKDEFLRQPAASDRTIAGFLGIDHKTVGRHRKSLVSTGALPQLEKSIGLDGKERPREVVRKPVIVYNPTPCEERLIKDTAVVERMAADNTDSPVMAMRRINQEQKAALKNADFKLKEEDYRLFRADIRDNGLSEIASNSVDVVITDPLYEKAAIPLYTELSKLASRILKDNGSLVVMCGNTYFPEFMQELTRHMKYWWTLAYMTESGGSTQLQWKRVFTYWKPVIWLVKKNYIGSMVYDVAKVPPSDKTREKFHEYEQSVEGFEMLLDRFSNVGDVVCDPFMGSGMSAAVPCTGIFDNSDNPEFG